MELITYFFLVIDTLGYCVIRDAKVAKDWIFVRTVVPSVTSKELFVSCLRFSHHCRLLFLHLHHHYYHYYTASHRFVAHRFVALAGDAS